MMTLLPAILLAFQILYTILILGSLCFYLACIYCTIEFFTQKRIDDRQVIVDRVSLLVPICGIDDQAWDNWSSFCHQLDCDHYEVLFGIADPTDPAIPTLKRLQATDPDRIHLFINLPPRGPNHKDSTLSYLLEQAQYNWLVLADSDIRVTPTYLHDVVAPLVADRADLITCAFIAHNPKHLGSALASLSRCCDFIPSALIARKLDGGLRFAIGMTIALSRETLARAGGLHLDRIGSDYNLGKRVAQSGARVELFHQILESDTGSENLRTVYQRELRWSRTIRFNRGWIYYTMIFCYGSVYSLSIPWFISLSNWSILVIEVTLITRYLQAWIACQILGGPQLIRWFPLLLLRDALSVWTWLIGCFGSTVHWRGRQLSIIHDGIIRELDSTRQG
jgi:ceramide glucosyltransferase